MKHEHAMCRANNIKQKRFLGGNLTKKKIKIAFFFPYLFFFFAFYLFFLHFTLYFSFSYILFFYFNIEDNVVFKV